MYPGLTQQSWSQSQSRPNTPTGKRNKYSRRSRTKQLTKPFDRIPTRVFLGKQAFPKQLSNTLRYAETVTLTLVGGVVIKQYSCNGMYDPRPAAGGTQPLYFDQLCGIYNHYTVVRSRCKFTPLLDSAITTASYHAAYIEDDTSTVANGANALERTTGRGGRVLAVSPPNPSSISISWSAKQAFGPSTMADPSMQGSVSANPTEQEYFTYVLQDPNGAATYECSLLVQLEYDCIWDEIVTITSS